MLIKPIRFINPNEFNYFFVDWFFGNKANVQIDYVENMFQDGSRPFPGIEAVKKFIHAFRKAHGNRPVNLKLTHGELFLYPDHKELMTFCKEEGVALTVTGTGSNDPQWWKDNIDLIDCAMLDYHTAVPFPNFNEIVNILYEHDVFSIININVLPSNFTRCEKIARALSKYERFVIDYRVRFHGVNTRLLDYTEEQKEKIKVQACRNSSLLPPMELHYDDGAIEHPTFNEMLLDKNYFCNWTCNVGIDQLVITHTGDIYRSWCGIDTIVGSIYTDIDLPINNVVCNRSRCINGFDLLAEKSR